MEDPKHRKLNGRIWSGLFLLLIGCVLLLDRLGFSFPFWFFKWPMLLIVIGIFIGLSHGFRSPGWIIIIILGCVFLLDMVEPDYAVRQYTLPLIIIALGLFMIFRPRGNRHRMWEWRREWYEKELAARVPPADAPPYHHSGFSQQDYIDSVVIFGGVRKVVVSKTFKGGEVFALFGGHEIDLSQADFEGQIILEVTQILGGTKILLPAHWDVKSEMVAILGGIEDKRQIPPGTNNGNKVLVLKGTSIFGGIDIRTY